jgi:CheY-like chemotaxis protein
VLNSSGSSPIILIVDDDPFMRGVLHTMLQLGPVACEIVTVPDGAAALEQIASRPIALAIVDYNMPGQDGVQLTAAIKRASPSTRILILSVLASPALAARAQSAGADALVAKPFHVAELRAIVETMIS